MNEQTLKLMKINNTLIATTTYYMTRQGKPLSEILKKIDKYTDDIKVLNNE